MRRSQNRDIILDAATAIIAAGEWQSVTFRKLADEAGLPLGTVYSRISDLALLPFLILDREPGYHRARLERSGLAQSVVDHLLAYDLVTAIALVAAMEKADRPCGYELTMKARRALAS